MSKQVGNNLYEPHSFMAGYGEFWRCRHGKMDHHGPCRRCGIKHPLRFIAHCWNYFLETV
jgi:hypothetical protein